MPVLKKSKSTSETDGGAIGMHKINPRIMDYK